MCSMILMTKFGPTSENDPRLNWSCSKNLLLHRTGDVYIWSSQPYISRNGGWIFTIVQQRREQEEDAGVLERL